MGSTAWKELERLVAKELGGRRISRGDDFSRKDVDVEVDDFEALRIDAKYRGRSWSHHAYLKEIEQKYCEEPHHIAVLVTKNPRQRGAVVSVQLDDFGLLLDSIRELKAEIEELERNRSGACPSIPTSAKSVGTKKKTSTR